MNGDKLREGIFALRTRRFGSVAECMVKLLGKYSQARNQFYDLHDVTNRLKIEVKFSTVGKKAEHSVTENTVLQCIEDAIAEKEPVLFSSWKKIKFDCNIQQVKRTEFDVLYYGLFFSDCVQIFRINSHDIRTRTEGGDMGYSDKQHKGNVGEGQFHITDKNLPTHLERYFHKTLTYDELYQLLAAESHVKSRG